MKMNLLEELWAFCRSVVVLNGLLNGRTPLEPKTWSVCDMPCPEIHSDVIQVQVWTPKLPTRKEDDCEAIWQDELWVVNEIQCWSATALSEADDGEIIEAPWQSRARFSSCSQLLQLKTDQSFKSRLCSRSGQRVRFHWGKFPSYPDMKKHSLFCSTVFAAHSAVSMEPASFFMLWSGTEAAEVFCTCCGLVRFALVVGFVVIVSVRAASML